jgi:hypothetical protein
MEQNLEILQKKRKQDYLTGSATMCQPHLGQIQPINIPLSVNWFFSITCKHLKFSQVNLQRLNLFDIGNGFFIFVFNLQYNKSIQIYIFLMGCQRR